MHNWYKGVHKLTLSFGNDKGKGKSKNVRARADNLFARHKDRRRRLKDLKAKTECRANLPPQNLPPPPLVLSLGIRDTKHFNSHAFRALCGTERRQSSAQEPMDHSWAFGSTDRKVQERCSENTPWLQCRSRHGGQRRKPHGGGVHRDFLRLSGTIRMKSTTRATEFMHGNCEERSKSPIPSNQLLCGGHSLILWWMKIGIAWMWPFL